MEVANEGEGEGESIMGLGMEMGLGLGLAMVPTSDSELTDLDIDARSISPTANSNASANESDIDDVDHSASCRQLLAATKKRIRKSSKSRQLKGNSKSKTTSPTQDFTDTDAVMTDSKEDIKFSAMMMPQLDANQPEEVLSSAYPVQDQPMDEVVLDIERRIIQMPCRNSDSVSPLNKFDTEEELLQNQQSELSNVNVPSQISEHFSRQINSQNSALIKPAREHIALTTGIQVHRAYEKDRNVSEMIRHLQLIRSRLISQVNP
ncbi:hypothetical protein ACLKA7_005178 [Drosophila subpalustris]